MNIEDQVVALFAKANPVPTLALLDPLEPVEIDALGDRTERSREMSEVTTLDSGSAPGRNQRPRLLAAAIAGVVVLAIGIGFFVSSTGPQVPATPVDRARVFWVAMGAGDQETALAQMAPGATALGGANTFGRAHTLEGQFDWYEVVDWHWELDECVETAGAEIECMVAGSNAWSDVLGVEPIVGTFIMEVGEDGIVDIQEKDESFISQWSPLAFEVFQRWVVDNRPADAELMFLSDADANQEILDLYEANTERFVEAHRDG